MNKRDVEYYSWKGIIERTPDYYQTPQDRRVSNCPEWCWERYQQEQRSEVYDRVKGIIRKYVDTTELNYTLLTNWVLGTYFHNQLETFPLIILNARKQCGKTRTLKLMSCLSCGSDGSVSTSVTETFLFRHKVGALFFDEMESLSSKEKGALRETINAVYKKGNKIIRYAEGKNNEGENDYIEKAFYPYYPLGIANIYGFGDVLEDRSLQIILQRSKKDQTKLIEDFNSNGDIIKLVSELEDLEADIPKEIFSKWNEFIQTGNVEDELKELFDKIHSTELNGRPLELFFPLFLVANYFDKVDELLNASKQYLEQLEGDNSDNIDDLLNTFIEGRAKNDLRYTTEYLKISEILNHFRTYLEHPEQWVNSRWLGRALKRLGFIKKKRLVNGHVQVLLNINSTNSTNSIISTNSTNSTKSGRVSRVSRVSRVNREGVNKENNPTSNKKQETIIKELENDSGEVLE